MSKVLLGIIGGSGLYQLPECTVRDKLSVETPYGAPSSEIVCGSIAGTDVCFLARHGQGHRFNPSEVPYRANIWALRSLGVTHVMAVNAVGSLREEIRPGDLVVPDQLIDRTKGIRPSTYFEDGIVAHIEFADPYCKKLANLLVEAAGVTGKTLHVGGTLVCMEGPQFSTRAESNLYRSWGGSLIGMTALPEAKLAREAGICYASLCLATDYDCWFEHGGDVSVNAVVAVMQANSAAARKTVVELARAMHEDAPVACCRGLVKNAVITNPALAGSTAFSRLKLLLED